MRRFIRAWALTTIAVLWPICVSAEVQENDRVAHKVHDVLKASGQMSGSSFVIKCQDGTALLEGRVSSDEQKTLALKLTGEVPEINEVVDHLWVEASKKAANPVVRLLSAPIGKPADQLQELSEETATEEATQASEADMPRIATDEMPDSPNDDGSSDDGSVFPETLPNSQPSEPGNLLVRQVANLRSIFHRQPAKAAPVAAAKQPASRNTLRMSGECTACDGRARSTPTKRVTPVASKKYRTTSPAPGASQSRRTTAGRVRMVPMIELADGSLVPVEQTRRTPSAASKGGQKVTTASRTRTMPNNRSRQSVARKQEIIDGPLDAELAAPMAGPVMHGASGGGPLPAYVPGSAAGVAPAYYDQPHMPNYSWPSYAAHPNYAGLTYPRQYSPTAWPYIGPFYPYPQVPLGWRKVTLEWDDGWWFLDFDDTNRSYAY